MCQFHEFRARDECRDQVDRLRTYLTALGPLPNWRNVLIECEQLNSVLESVFVGADQLDFDHVSVSSFSWQPLDV